MSEEIKQEENKIQPIDAKSENNFDIKEKNSTKTDNFLNDPKYQDIKDTLSQTIKELSKDSTLPNFDKNIQSVVETIFSDPLLDPDDKTERIRITKNTFLFRTLLIAKEKESTSIQKKSVNIQKESVNIQKYQIKQNELSVNIQKESTKSQLYTELMTKYDSIDNSLKIQDGEEAFNKEFNKYKNITSKEEFTQLSKEEQNNYIKARYTAEKIADQARKSPDKKISQSNFAFITQFNALDTELKLDNKIDISDLHVESIVNKVAPRPLSMDDIIQNDNL